MSDAPLISVIVPFFDSEPYIAQCVEALLDQSGVDGPIEIFCIDNGSSDRSRAIVESYPDLIVLEELTPGAYAARNAGIRRATAPVVAFTDADCVVSRDWARAVLEGMEEPTTGILLGECRYPSGASWTLKALGAYEKAKTEYVVEHCGAEHRFAYANNMAVRRRIFDELGPFLEWDRAADCELVHRLSAQRPELKLAYQPSMKVTHLEFVRARDRVRRLSLYTRTNAKIDTFRELDLGQRLGVLMHWVRSH